MTIPSLMASAGPRGHGPLLVVSFVMPGAFPYLELLVGCLLHRPGIMHFNNLPKHFELHQKLFAKIVLLPPVILVINTQSMFSYSAKKEKQKNYLAQP